MQWLIDAWNIFVERWDWWYLNIPIVAAVIGWGTNVLALKMTFYPLEFVGFGIKGLKPIGWGGLPPIGWQGIIPNKAGVMAGKSVDLITSKLIDIQEQFARIDPKVVAKEMEPSMLRLARQITNEIASKHVPLWKLLPQRRKEAIYQRAAETIPQITEQVMAEVKENITEIFDLKKMAVDQLTRDKDLLNRIFLEVGHKEFKFIEISGAYFGGLFGFIQMIIWTYYAAWWQLPVGGLLVGYLTNWLALKMIFEPVKPRRILFWKVQGLFLKRQQEVSREYGKIISENIMTMPNIFEAMFKGPGTDKLLQIIEEHISEGIDQTAGFTSSLVKLTSGTKTYDEMKIAACQSFVEAIPGHIHLIFDYAKQALDIEHTLHSKMSSLPPDEFVGFLRPVFQEDEWKLILVGAILGMVAGFLQLPIS